MHKAWYARQALLDEQDALKENKMPVPISLSLRLNELEEQYQDLMYELKWIRKAYQTAGAII